MINDIRNIELYEEAVLHFNEPAIVGLELFRLVGYHETGIDCYFTFRGLNGMIIHNSCVGGYFWLTEVTDLNKLSDVMALNGCPKEDKLLVDIDHNDVEREYQGEYAELLTKYFKLRQALVEARQYINDWGPDSPGDPACRTNDMLAKLADILNNPN